MGMIRIVRTTKDLQGRPPLASLWFSFEMLFFHGGNTDSNPGVVQNPLALATPHEVKLAVSTWSTPRASCDRI
jgi:hypothetical protein